MYSVMPQTPPRFTFGRPGGAHYHHRPVFSSPLSSSPIRASSPSPPPDQQHNQQQQHSNRPLSPCGPNVLNTLPRPQHTQSSPIFPSRSFGTSPTAKFDQDGASASAGATFYGTNPKFRFSSRNPRPNPLLRRREDAAEGRRRLFFQNVRQRQEDKRWEIRGGEDELLRLEWLRFQREQQQAAEAELAKLAPMLDPDILAREEEEFQRMRQQANSFAGHQDDDPDALMADVIAQQEEAEVQALLEAFESSRGAPGQEQQHQQQYQFLDDDDDDDVLMELIRQEEQGQRIVYSQDVEMS